MLVSVPDEFPAGSKVWWVVLAGREVVGEVSDEGSVEETFVARGGLVVLAWEGGWVKRFVCDKKMNDNTPAKAVKATKRMATFPNRLFIFYLTT